MWRELHLLMRRRLLSPPWACQGHGCTYVWGPVGALAFEMTSTCSNGSNNMSSNSGRSKPNGNADEGIGGDAKDEDGKTHSRRERPERQ